MSLAFSYIHKCKLAAIDRSVLFVFPSKNGSDSLNSEAAVFFVWQIVFTFITVISSGIFFRWTRALFRGHAARRACPTRKGSACDFGRGRRACSWGEEITRQRGGQGKSFRSARLGLLLIGSASVLMRSEWRWVSGSCCQSRCWRASGRYHTSSI